MAKVKVDINATDNASKKVKDVEKNVSGAAKKMAGKIAALGAAYVGVNTAVSYFNDYVRTYGDRLNKLSSQLDISVASLDKFGQLAKLGGTNLDQVAVSLKFMNKAIGESAMGLGEARNAFKSLNIDVNELKNLSPEDQFIQLSSALMKVKDRSTQVALGNKILGEQFTSMIPMLSTIEDQFGKTSTAWDDQSAKNVADFNDNLEILSNDFKENFIPAVSSAINIINKFFHVLDGSQTKVELQSSVINQYKDQIQKAEKALAGFKKYGIDETSEAYQTQVNRLELAKRSLEQYTKTVEESRKADAEAAKNVKDTSVKIVNPEDIAKSEAAIEASYVNILRYGEKYREADLLANIQNYEQQKKLYKDNEEYQKIIKQEYLAAENAINREYDEQQAQEAKAQADKLAEIEATKREEFLSEHKRILDEAAAYDKEQSEKMIAYWDRYNDMFSSGVTDAFLDFATGAQSAEDAFKSFAASFLRQIAQMIIQQQIFNAISSVYGGGGGGAVAGTRASGGSVDAGKTYLVGEQGPEFLTMGSKSGYITPNSKISGGGATNNINNNITVQVKSTGNDIEDRKLSKMYADTIVYHVDKRIQKLTAPGGSLSRRR